MKSVRFHRYGAPDVLTVDEVPAPRAGPGEAIVRVRAVGVNHVDLDMRSGASRYDLPLPHTLGREFAGVVESIADGAAFRKGDRVWAISRLACRTCSYCLTGRDNLCDHGTLFGLELPGAYAELIKVPIESLRRLPDAVSFEQGAAFQIAFGTAWHCLVTLAGLQAGHSVLVTNAGSGVGSAAIQVARLAGAQVLASASTEQKRDRARQYGAHHAVDSGCSDLAEQVRSTSGGHGVDVVMENAGGEQFGRSLQCVRKGGVVVIVGAHAGETVELDLIPLFRHEIRVFGSRISRMAELPMVMDLIAQGSLSPVIHCTLPLSRAPEAHEILASRSAFGKVVLVP